MNKLLLLITICLSTTVHASHITYGTTWATNGTVTSQNLNGNFSNVSQVVNGGLDNTNANTTQGYRFYQTVAVLPSPGNQGSVYFLTSDNTLNFDTGSSFIKSIGTSTASPAQGDLIYYTGSAWADLAAGTSGQFLKTNGTNANPSWVDPTATNLNVTGQAQGAILYYNSPNWIALGAGGTTGLVLRTNTTSGSPTWVNSLGGVKDYGTSASSSTDRQGTAWLVAAGQVALSSGNATISNLAFSSSTSFYCTVTRIKGSDVSQAVQINSQTASTLVIRDSTNSGDSVNWICMGT